MKADRRRFLRAAAAGGALVTMPVFLSGCGLRRAAIVEEPMPGDPFLDWFALDRGRLARVMSTLTGKGADAAEIYLQHRRESVMRLERGDTAPPRTDVVQGAGLRVLAGGRRGFAYTEDLSLEGLLAAARAAADGFGAAPVAAPVRYTLREPGDLYVTEIHWGDVGRAAERALLERVDALCRSADPAVDDVRISLSGADERILIATHTGELVADRRPMTRLSVQVSATKNGSTQEGFASIAARAGPDWYTEARLADVAGRAVSNTLTLFEARLAPAGELPVILAAGSGGVVLHESIGHAFEADFVRDGVSPYAGRLGDAVAHPSLTLVDEARLPNRRGALNYDDEGVRGRRNVLVGNGVLRSFLHDRASAAHFAVPVTGSARRESYRDEPMPRMTCTYIENGPHAPGELIEAVERGVIVAAVTGGDVSLGSGDYTFAVRHGWLVEKGRVVMPLRDFEISGNGPQTLRDVTMLADDMRFDDGGWTCGKNGQRVPVSQGMPSALVSSLGVRSAV